MRCSSYAHRVTWSEFLEKLLIAVTTPAVLVALIASVAAIMTARAAFAGVSLKRRLETAQRFTELAEIANNRKQDQGVYQQVAAIWLMGSFGRDEKHLREAAKATLDSIKGWDQIQGIKSVTAVTAAAKGARALIKN